MSKPFTLKPTKNFRKMGRLKACGNCKYLLSEEYGMVLRCARPAHGRGVSPAWQHHAGNYAHQVFAQVWTHVCDRWAKNNQTQ
jgi:hypothetical protein